MAPLALTGDAYDSQVSQRLRYCKRDEYTSQHCCDKTMDDKVVLHRGCSFANCTKLW